MRTFIPFADQNGCSVSREELNETIKFNPAETDQATYLIGIALGMENMKTLPSHIAGSPFVLRFFEDDFIRLEREDAEGTIRFRWDEGDDLIVALQDALKMAINERTLVKSARGTGGFVLTETPFI